MSDTNDTAGLCPFCPTCGCDGQEQGKNCPACGKPRWNYSTYRATLYLNGEVFAIVSPDGRNALGSKDVAVLLQALREAADTGWQEMKSAPKTAEWVQVLLSSGSVKRAHWASDLSGEQPAYEGWFERRSPESDGFKAVIGPVAWQPLKADFSVGERLERAQSLDASLYNARLSLFKLAKDLPKHGQVLVPVDDLNKLLRVIATA